MCVSGGNPRERTGQSEDDLCTEREREQVRERVRVRVADSVRLG